MTNRLNCAQKIVDYVKWLPKLFYSKEAAFFDRIAFHPSSEVAERAYELIHAERDGSLTEEERQELESYMMIEYLMELVKLEAHKQLRQQAS